MILIALGLCGAAAPVHAAPPDADAPPKASSFAPRHSANRVYGSPIEPKILHSRKRKPATHHASPPASPSHAAAARQP
jgi:hypothetical protein